MYFSKPHHILLFESLKSTVGSTTKPFNILLTGTILRYQSGKLGDTSQGWKPCGVSVSHMLLDYFILFLRERHTSLLKVMQKIELNTPANAESQRSTLPLSLYGL